jgi:hypothetical protein
MVPEYDEAGSGMISSWLNYIRIVDDGDRTFGPEYVGEVRRVSNEDIEQQLDRSIELFARNETWLVD